MSPRVNRHPDSLIRGWIALLAGLLAMTFSVAMPAAAAGSVTDFDGVYQVVFQYSSTSAHVDSVVPPASPIMQSFSTTMTVKNGMLLQSWVQVGTITNPNGSGQLSMPLATPFLGDCVGPLQFTRDATANLGFTGQCQRVDTWVATNYGEITTTYTESRILTGVGTSDSIRFAVDAKLPTAHRGKAYPGKGHAPVSFCVPPVASGRLCGGGLGPTPISPSGGPANVAGGAPVYIFSIKPGSGFLPTGLVLNHRTGTITGTPLAKIQPRTFKFMVCAFTSIDNRYDACQWTSIMLK